jgi:hypothetical protein
LATIHHPRPTPLTHNLEWLLGLFRCLTIMRPEMWSPSTGAKHVVRVPCIEPGTKVFRPRHRLCTVGSAVMNQNSIRWYRSWKLVKILHPAFGAHGSTPYEDALANSCLRYSLSILGKSNGVSFGFLPKRPSVTVGQSRPALRFMISCPALGFSPHFRMERSRARRSWPTAPRPAQPSSMHEKKGPPAA